MKASWYLWSRSLLAEATSGATAISGLVGVGAMLAIAAAADFSGFVAGGANILNSGLSACLLVGPLFAGMAAMRAGRLRQQGATHLAATTPRGRSALLGTLAIAFVAWAVVAVLAFTVVAAAIIGPGGPWPATVALLPVQTFVFLAACVSLGVVIGDRLPSTIVGPVLSIGLLLLVNLLDLAPRPVGDFSAGFPEASFRYGTQPAAPFVAALTSVWFGVTLLMVFGGFHMTRRRAAAGAAIAALLTGAGAFSLTAGAGRVVEARTGSVGECRSLDGVTLCVWPGPDVEINSMLRDLVDVRDVVSRFAPVPNSFHEEGLNAPANSVIVPVPKPGDTGSGSVFAREAMVPAACDDTSLRTREEVFGLVNDLLVPGSMGTEGPFGLGAAQTSGTLAQQRAWIAPRIAALESCD